MVTSTQLTHEYGNDWAKSKSRELYREVIERNLLRFRRPKDLKALCFLGIDGAELTEVYDTLGIPRENIYCVERDSVVADEIEKKFPRVKVLRGELSDVVEDRKFPTDLSLLALDYTGPISWKQLENLRVMIGSQERDQLVLHHANLIRRDKNSQGVYLVGSGLDDGVSIGDRDVAFGDLYSHMQSAGSAVRVHKRMKDGLAALKSGNGKDVKSSAYSQMIQNAFVGSTLEGMDEAFKFSCGNNFEFILRRMVPSIQNILGTGESFEIDIERPLGSLFEVFGIRPDLVKFFESQTLYNLRVETNKLVLFKPELYDDLAPMLMFPLSEARKGSKYFTARDIEKYSYISNTGDPMIGDIYFLSHPARTVKLAREVSELMGFPNQFEIKNPERFNRKLVNYFKEREKFISLDKLRILEESSRQRQFLGSSSKPVLTKGRAIDEFRSGLSDEAIKEKYRGWKNKAIPQWRAHFTRGTYGDEPQETDECLVEHKEDSDLEKLTREEIYDLIDNGIPIEEIHAAYPTSASMGSLRAYKAHHTMGHVLNGNGKKD
ncbi:MAG: hypothetical protein ABIF88_01785 [archaeon]